MRQGEVDGAGEERRVEADASGDASGQGAGCGGGTGIDENASGMGGAYARVPRPANGTRLQPAAIRPCAPPPPPRIPAGPGSSISISSVDMSPPRSRFTFTLVGSIAT